MNKIIQRQRIANTCRIRLPLVVVICFPLILSHLRCFDVQGIYNYTVCGTTVCADLVIITYVMFSIKICDLDSQYRCIQKLPTIRLKENIADTKWIYATYRIFGFGVKSGSRKMRLQDNKEGEPIGSDSPL